MSPLPSTATVPLRTLALTTAALIVGTLVASSAGAQAVPHTRVLGPKVVAADAVDDYWTADRLKNARPMVMPRPAQAPNLDSQALLRQPNSQPQHTEGKAPAVDLGSALSKQLFTPDASRPGADAAGVQPDNVGNFGAYFTTSRVFPDVAMRTYPNSAIGKLYFTDPQTKLDYVCSASAISPRLIVTAGHCVAHADPTSPYFYYHWLYVPSTNGGAAPFGKWKATWATTTSNWYYSNGSVPNVQDVGVLVATDTKVLGSVHRLGDLTGWLGTWTQWGRSYPNNITQVGYPCNLDSCYKMEINNAQGVGIWNNTVQIGSAMQGGSSGGPWIQDYGVYPAGGPSYTAGNWVLGVTSWGYTDTTQMGQGASIFENAGYSGNGFGDLYNLACGEATGNC